jgi:sugar lactone lactonase YvrE
MIWGAMIFPAEDSGKLELVAEGFSFPTSVAFDEAGVVYVAESGLPFGGAPPGGLVWRLARDGGRSLLAEGLRPPVNGLTFHAGGLYVSEGGHPGRISRLEPDGQQRTTGEAAPWATRPTCSLRSWKVSGMDGPSSSVMIPSPLREGIHQRCMGGERFW